MRLFALLTAASLGVTTPTGLVQAGPPNQPENRRAEGVWINVDELSRLPAAGDAWEAVKAHADMPLMPPNLSDQNDMVNVQVLAKALVYGRTEKARYREEVIDACMAAMGTEKGGRTLSLGRELMAYVAAADLVKLPPTEDKIFRRWLRAVRDEVLQKRTLRSTHNDRPNNWGTHAGASRAAVAVYLGDHADLRETARVFKGYLGDRSSYSGFKYGPLDWQADRAHPVGINPKGTTRRGHSVDGVLPDDQRRCCERFTWPPPKEEYVYEGLQGALAAAYILHRAGYDPWEWQDRALLRAFTWLHREADFPAEGDDTWQPHLINYYYDTDFPSPNPSRPGKNTGFTDWTHSRGGN